MTEAGKQLVELVTEDSGGLDGVRAFLDALEADQRVAAVGCLHRKAQRTLWERAAGFCPLSLSDLVPADHPPLSPVRHHGRNSLLAFTRFEKRFYRLSGRAELGGANFQGIGWLTGPGYYLAREDGTRGEVVIDYAQLPEARPEGWPTIASNERGISRLVFGFMVDRLRRVSEHVTIGRASRHGQELSAWFVLCREATPVPAH